jgi:hypothetical protein
MRAQIGFVLQTVAMYYYYLSYELMRLKTSARILRSLRLIAGLFASSSADSPNRFIGDLDFFAIVGSLWFPTACDFGTREASRQAAFDMQPRPPRRAWKA